MSYFMKMFNVSVPDYNSEKGFEYLWEADFYISTNFEDGSIKICANAAGLKSLANHLLNLSQDQVPNGYHLHLDEYNSLEPGSNEVIIEKI
jgi:hypothetical protein